MKSKSPKTRDFSPAPTQTRDSKTRDFSPAPTQKLLYQEDFEEGTLETNHQRRFTITRISSWRLT